MEQNTQNNDVYSIAWLHQERTKDPNFNIVHGVSKIINNLNHLEQLEIWQKKTIQSILKDLNPSV